jgi:hypothetical protein
MHFNLSQSGAGDDELDGDDEEVDDAEPDGSAVPEPVGVPSDVGVSDGITADGDPPAREGLGPVGTPHAASTTIATAPDTATSFNRRRLTTPERYGSHRANAHTDTGAERHSVAQWVVSHLGMAPPHACNEPTPARVARPRR